MTESSSEFYNLFNKKNYLPKMRPLPPLPSSSLNEFDTKINETKSLVKFQIDKVRSKEVEQLIVKRAAKAMVKTQKNINKCDAVHQCHLCVPRKLCVQQMKLFADHLPTVGLDPNWERNIKRLVCEKLTKKYPESFKLHIKDVKDCYLRKMHESGVNFVVSQHMNCNSIKELNFKYGGRTIYRPVYLKNRQYLEENFFLSHKLMRNIFLRAHMLLPNVICDLKVYGEFGFLEPGKLFDLIEDDINNQILLFKNTYYTGIVTLVTTKRYISNIPKNVLPSFLQCASTLLSYQIISTLISNIRYLLHAFNDDLIRPKLNLKLKCENNDIFVIPSKNDFCLRFHMLLDKLSDVGLELTPLEQWVAIETNYQFIPTTIPYWLTCQSHEKLTEVLNNLWQSVEYYVADIRDKFKIIYSFESNAEIDKFIKEDHTFEEYSAKIDDFNRFIQEIDGLAENEYLEIGRINQIDAKMGLKNHAKIMRQNIISELLLNHRNFNQSICRSFENVKERAINISDTTKELLELGKYMIYASTKFIEEKKEQITLSVQKMILLIEMTTLDDDDIKLNKETVNWLTKITPIFERSSSLYEAMKFNLEEQLQKKINDLNVKVDDMFARLVIMDDMDDANRVREYIEDMRKLVRHLGKLDEEVAWINNEENLFGFPQTAYSRIDDLKDVIFSFYELIYRCVKWQRDSGVWLDGPFEYLDSSVIESRTAEYYTNFCKTSKEYRAKIKMQISTGHLYIFAGSLDDPDPYQQPAPLKLCYQLIENIKWFQQYVPLAVCFVNPALSQRHWDEMSSIAEFDITPDAGTTLRKIINQDLMKDLNTYITISIGASKEQSLREVFYNIKAEWDHVCFKTIVYKDAGLILSQVDEVQTFLEEHIVKIQAMRGSAFVKPIKAEVKVFYELLLRIKQAIYEWINVQIQWLYLLPIFSSKDIVAQLPTEGVMFEQVNRTFRETMQAVMKDPCVKNIAGSEGLYEMLKKSNEMMERVNNGVVNYLEEKRLFFSRFFFLSNDDMLEILSETKDPLRVQPHLKKCFEGIARLGFNKQLDIYSMISDDKETIKLQKIISTAAARGCVERWLIQVEQQMVMSVKHEIMMSYYDYNRNERSHWVLIWPGQVVLCVAQIYWTSHVQNSLLTNTISALKLVYENLKTQMIDMINLVRGTLKVQNRTTLNALITIDVHAQDVVKLLIDKRIMSETDFEWLAQLRYYWDDNVLVRIINATVQYAYEYLGNCPRLVITPLTDRCYRTLIGAYSLHLNGAPEGPAGTGKTETTKDLARAIAVQCVVFNCSEGLDYKNMGKFFKGLASCGAWACFDEFNRIELEVLSVVAQQILCITQAVRAGLDTFVFEGTELTLNAAVYICITMNPGYAGRSELPDNLKVLFRTVAMMVPDYAMIAEIFLYSSGFSEARILAVKIVSTYKLCSEQLSTQSHYDYGMRAVKTVLTAAQNFKLRYPNEDETVLILRSIIDVNLPKFLNHDIQLFEGIISDLFPGVTLPPPSYDNLTKAVREIAERRNLQPVEGFLLKVIQTYEMLIVRHGFMLVGEPFGSKTSILHTLADALALMKEWNDVDGVETMYTTINPKSISMGQLYGQFDPVSLEWTDGIVAVVFRNYCTDETSSRKWIIFDGPVDAVWIENLNTVLDDNKKLCLTSGEVMQMTSVMSMIFETMDLLQASPATVSRCGMIYIEPAVFGWRPSVESWYKTLDQRWSQYCLEHIRDLFEWLNNPCLEFTRKNCRISLHCGQINQVLTTCNLFAMYCDDAAAENNDKDVEENICAWIQAAIILAMVWGIGGTLDTDSRDKFNDFCISLWKNQIEMYPMPSRVTENLISLPSEGSIYDNYYIFKGKGAWKTYIDAVKQEKVIDMASIGQIIVPTIDTMKYQSLFLQHIKHRKRFLLYGDTGTGKTFYIQDVMMNKLDQANYLPNLITFTARTSAAAVQELVISKLFRRKKGHYGPTTGTHYVVFIDDVNMPAKEIYGAQPAIELLRQAFDHDHWYDLKDPEKIRIFDTTFICAMGPPGGSRQEIYHRFLRHFNLFSINNFSNESIQRIFTNIALIGLKRNGFASDVNSVVNGIVNATLDIFKRACNELRPTPTKSHYLFNLRDFSRVITGCAMIKKESVESKAIFSRLWVHEILRVFGDRLIDQDDRHWLFVQLKSIVATSIKDSFDTVFDHLPKFDDHLTEESLRSLIFGNFMDPDALLSDRKYEEVMSMKEFRDIVLQSLDDYNTTHKNRMEIVTFRYALEHLARICRILAIPGGSLLMVGVGGLGRQSLTRLASNIAGYDLFQPEIGSAYGVHEWREDIKRVLKTSGGTGKNLTFLINEGQIKNEVFLSDINSLLNSGEVPNLFNAEEKQEIIELCRFAAQGGDRNLDISVLSVLSFFINRCKDKLHIMLCLSPIGESLRTKLRLFPSLVNCCTIDWFDVWPEDALEQVAIQFTTEINIMENDKVNAVKACKYFHGCAKTISDDYYSLTGQKTYVTTASFLDLIRTYAKLMNEKQSELSQARDRYLNGLDKLAFAAQQIESMRKTLEKLRPELEESAIATTEMMKKIEGENLAVEQATILVKQDEVTANHQAKIARVLKAECEADLAGALPVLEEALAALDILKPADISFVKAMKNPPAGVKLVMAAICVMLNIPPDKRIIPETGRSAIDYWSPSKRLLSDIKFLEHLKNYDKDNIPVEIIAEIRKTYLSDKSFEPSVVAKASQAAEGLCKWVRAMVLYDKVVKEVAPKKAKLEAAELDYSEILAVLEEKRRTLADLNEKLAKLKAELQKILANKIDLENQVSNCKSQLMRAEKLINGLGGEKDRWTARVKDLQKYYDFLPGDILISCAIIAYLGPFTSAYRADCTEKWVNCVKELKIPSSKNYSFVNILGTEIKINSWNIFGLPRDTFSTENAIIMSNSKRWSLFIDPQSQANKWIRNMEKLSELEIVKLSDDNYMKTIELCIEFGKPVLIENINEKLDAPLDPLLTKSMYSAAGELYIVCGDNTIPYDTRFRLYMTTKLRNPHFLPEVFNKVTLINFALTITGLEDQLLGIVVAKERPDLQEKREYLIIQSAANKKALKDVEDNILKTLSTSGSRILEDEEAIEILDSSKILSVSIMQKQESAKDTENKIELFRQSYKPIAKHSSALYYTLTDLSNIDPMYQFSLAWFINLYIMSIETANKSKILERRLMFLRDTFTYNLYQNVCRSLFERDKLLYSFLLYTTILLARELIKHDDLMFLLTGGLTVSSQIVENPANDWLPSRSWEEICRVDRLESFAGFSDHFTANLHIWRQFYDAVNPENIDIPAPWNENLTDFQNLIVMRLMRPDKVTRKVGQFVEAGMGGKFVLPPPFDIAKSYADSNCLIPLIFILSSGSDPMGALTNFATSINFTTKFHSISLGQGQGLRAQKIIEEAQLSGGWVCLQNCHLAVSWMPILEKICENFDVTNTSTSFRLWLTSYPNDKFPISILESGVKMTNEPPMGLQQNLLRSYTSEPVNNPEFFEGCHGKERTFSRLLYGLCFFHALVQERRNYGTQGWNIKYGFNESDFEISVCQLQIFINEYNEVPFKAITYLTGECNYGGRVTDDRDRRCLMTILEDFYNPDVVNNSNYTFSTGTEYSLPKKCDYLSYIKQIQSLPVNPSPEVFGLHLNAGISRDLEISRNFFNSMTMIQDTVVLGGDTTEQVKLLITIKNDIYNRLPPLFDIEESKKVYPVSYEESMNTVCIQEIERYNILHQEIRKTLIMMENSVLGMIVMTAEIEVFIQHILNAKLPPTWIKASAYPSLKLLSSFVNDFLERLKFFDKWLQNGKPNAFWISGFSFIHGFLTGAMQNYARKYKISIDKIDFDFEVMPAYSLSEAPDDGVYVYGMYLVGGRWDIDKTILVESHPKVLRDLIPIVWLKPSQVSCIVTGKRYECPLYITSERFGTLKTTGHSTNYVLMILLGTALPVSHWIKRGLALLCQLDD